jgi:hypothetical protein
MVLRPAAMVATELREGPCAEGYMCRALRWLWYRRLSSRCRVGQRAAGALAWLPCAGRFACDCAACDGGGGRSRGGQARWASSERLREGRCEGRGV